jgi:DNA-binding NarL/FixJ family response regulator
VALREPAAGAISTPAEPQSAQASDPPTPRQREVAALIAQGLTNRQIAERLVVTERAAAAHVENILDKLGVSSRAQIAVWASEHGLLTARCN